MNIYQEVAYSIDDTPPSWPELIHAAFENARKLNRPIRLWIEAYQLGAEEEPIPLCVLHPDGKVVYELHVEDDRFDLGFESILGELRELIEEEKRDET